MHMKSSSLKRMLVAGSAAVVLGGAAVGVAAAQQVPTNTGTPTAHTRFESFIDALAAKLNVSPETLKQDIRQVRQEQGLNGPRGGHEGLGWFGDRGGMRGVVGHELQVAADALKIPVDQLRTELRGKSLADVARAHNVDPTVVADALKADAHARIDQAVSSGKLTADRAATLKQRVDARLDQMMTRTLPQRPAHGPRDNPSGQGGQG